MSNSRGVGKVNLLVGIAVLMILVVTEIVGFGLSAPTATWTRQVDGPVYTAQVNEGLLVFSTSSETLTTVDVATGTKCWTHSSSEVIGSPVIRGRRVFLRTKQKQLIALDGESGEIV